MSHICIIGLPKALRRRAESTLEVYGVIPYVVVADAGKRGKLQIVPSVDDAIQTLRSYCDDVAETYSDADVIVLPYTPIPDLLYGELDALESMGAQVTFIGEPESGWPTLAERQKPDTTFLNKLFECLLTEVLGETDEAEPPPPSMYIRSLTEQCPQLIVVGDALDQCDDVAPHRYEFIRNTADALVELIDKKGNVGRLDAFFREKGIEHAQTGGITIKLKVSHKGGAIHDKSASTHLKKGDHTTPQAAARIYYQECHHDEELYIFVLYAGPHPDTDFSREHELQM